MPDKILLNAVSGVLDKGANAVEKVAGVFTSNVEKDAQRSAEEQLALMESYQAEFHNRQNRNWVDSLADGVNRLIRPVIVSIIIFIFVIAYINPERFAEISIALGSIPNGYWALLSVIISFYFGGRMQLKSQNFQVSQAQAQAVKALIETKKEFRKLEMDTDEPDRKIGDSVAKSNLVDTERADQTNEVTHLFLNTEESEREKKLKEKIASLQNEPEDSILKRRRLGGPRRRR